MMRLLDFIDTVYQGVISPYPLQKEEANFSLTIK